MQLFLKLLSVNFNELALWNIVLLEDFNHSTDQDNAVVQQCVHRNPQHDPPLSQRKPVLTLASCFFKIYLNIIIQSMPRSIKQYSSFMFCDSNFVCISLLPLHAVCIICLIILCLVSLIIFCEDYKQQTLVTTQKRLYMKLLTLRLLISYIYEASSKARNANVVYIWTYVWQR